MENMVTPTSNKTTEKEGGIHLHCLSCYSLFCHIFKQCPMVYCSNQCGVQHHQCKEKEHVHVCREQIRPCVNKLYGCPFEVTSVELLTHLEVCPANVIHCPVNWNRAPLYSKVREQCLPFHDGNPVSVEGQLDVEFALADQERLRKEYRYRMIRGARKRSSLNKKVGRIEKTRIKDLERLISGGKTETDIPTSEAKDEVINNVFVTCDKLFHEELHEAGNKDHVSNTNIRAKTNYIYKQQIITGSEPVCKSWLEDDEDPLTLEEIDNRRQVHDDLGCKAYGAGLGLNINVECLEYYNDEYPLYRFPCGSLFRRDQYKWHCQNSHGDIGFHVNGWLMQRCPLAQFGCPYSQYRFQPKDRSVRFLKNFSCFTAPYNDFNLTKKTGNSEDVHIFDLPNELLIYVLFFLDNLSLNCLAKTCYFFQDLCCSIVDRAGLVIVSWCKKTYEKCGSSSWKDDKKIRMFSTGFSPIRHWTYNEVPHIGQHLKTCAFFKRRNLGDEKIKLPVIS
ncbi:F-box only protein 30-like [Clytia hemisphaerica]|uniref:Uncharacterized protein n=1 Tax=Clytia hemisphaerica TaxID=252671 RepID=A0A7M5UN39_9CNID